MQHYRFELILPSRTALETLCADYPYHPAHPIFTNPNFLLFLHDLHPPKSLYILVALHYNTPVMLLPFTSKLRSPPLPPLLMPATNPHIPLQPPILHPSHTPALLGALTWLKNSHPWSKFPLPYQPPLSATQSAHLQPLYPLTVPHIETAYFPCKTTTPNIPPSLLKNLQRLHRKATAQGGLHLTITTDPSLIPQALQTFIDIEYTSWKQTTGTAIYQDPLLVNAYHTLVRNLSSTNQLQIHTLLLNNTPIAAQLILNDFHTLHILKIAYNPAFSTLSPGRLLLLKTLEHTCTHPTLQEVSLITNPPWASEWKPHTLQNYHTTIFSPTFYGFLLSNATKGYRRLRTYLPRKPTSPPSTPSN